MKFMIYGFMIYEDSKEDGGGAEEQEMKQEMYFLLLEEGDFKKEVLLRSKHR